MTSSRSLTTSKISSFMGHVLHHHHTRHEPGCLASRLGCFVFQGRGAGAPHWERRRLAGLLSLGTTQHAGEMPALPVYRIGTMNGGPSGQIFMNPAAAPNAKLLLNAQI